MSYLTVIRSHDRKVAINYYYYIVCYVLRAVITTTIKLDGLQCVCEHTAI